MKKLFRPLLLIVFCFALCCSLCGCRLLDKVDLPLENIMDKLPWAGDTSAALEPLPTEASQLPENGTYVLTGPTNFYQEPDTASALLVTYYAGQSIDYSTVITISGVTWAQAEAGWFMIGGEETETDYVTTDQQGVLTQACHAFSSPSLSGEIVAELSAGTAVRIFRLYETTEVLWGDTDYGWIPLSAYVRLDDLTQAIGYGVIRDPDARLYPAPDVYSGVAATPNCGSRHSILAVVTVDGADWYYTPAGWAHMDALYLEGSIGFRPCTATVIDPTPLNVRLAPGTDNDVLTTLNYGDRVNILEQVQFNGSYWGYTGTGWIFMELTEID